MGGLRRSGTRSIGRRAKILKEHEQAAKRNGSSPLMEVFVFALHVDDATLPWQACAT